MGDKAALVNTFKKLGKEANSYENAHKQEAKKPTSKDNKYELVSGKKINS